MGQEIITIRDNKKLHVYVGKSVTRDTRRKCKNRLFDLTDGCEPRCIEWELLDNEELKKFE